MLMQIPQTASNEMSWLRWFIIMAIMAFMFESVNLAIHWIQQRNWRHFAETHKLKFKAAGLRPMFSKTDRMKGIYKGRKLEFAHTHQPYYSNSWSPSTIITLPLRGTKRKRFIFHSKRIIVKGAKHPIGNAKFDKKIIVQSNPSYFAAEVMADDTLREDFLATFSFTANAKLELKSDGQLSLKHQHTFKTAAKLEYALDLLCDLADAIEEVAKNS